nr:MAG TPA: hypothetical protein [Caudoviricetes sp.]
MEIEQHIEKEIPLDILKTETIRLQMLSIMKGKLMKHQSEII